MKRTSRISVFLIALVVALIASCSVGNKEIPDPNGNIIVDTTGNAGGFTLFVSDDTVFTINILSDSTFNIIRNDSLIIIGANNLVSPDVICFFATKNSIAGVYSTELTAPATATFLARIKVGSSLRTYLLTHGEVTITNNDTINKVVRGNFNVSNDSTSTVDKVITMKANFALRYKNN